MVLSLFFFLGIRPPSKRAPTQPFQPFYSTGNGNKSEGNFVVFEKIVTFVAK